MAVKFDFIIGNPPYQGDNHMQLYPDFYVSSIEIGKCVELIFPIGWQKPTNANHLKKMNSPAVKEDKQIVFIHNVDVFTKLFRMRFPICNCILIVRSAGF